MGSLLCRAPALLLLESCLLALFLRDGGIPLWGVLSVAQFVLGGQMLISEERWAARKALFAGGLFVLSLTLPLWLCLELEREEPLPGGLTGRFMVTDRRPWGNGELLQLEDGAGAGWIAAAPRQMKGVVEGDLVRFSAQVAPLKVEGERSEFSPSRYWRARGVRGELRNISAYGFIGKSFSIHRFRQLLRERIEKLPPKSGALTAAVLLGDREASLREDHRRWGTSHILAVSGWHVALALALACVIFGTRRSGLLCGSVFLWFYCLVSGASMSALRAAAMLQISMAGLWFGRSRSLVNALSVAGVLMLLRNPWTAFDVGWQLSVLAALTLAGLEALGDWGAALLSSPVMWFMTSPLIAPMAGGLYLSSLPINAVASVVFSFILGIVLLSALPVLAGLEWYFFSLPAELLLKLWALVADWWTDLLPRALPVNFFPAWLCAAALYLLAARALRLSWVRSFLLCLSGGFLVFLI